jgi:hypothetical protein
VNAEGCYEIRRRERGCSGGRAAPFVHRVDGRVVDS